MLWARAIRGSSSRAKAVILRALSAAMRVLSSNGLRRPISTEPSGRAAISSAEGGVTRRVRPALAQVWLIPSTSVTSL